MNIMKNKKALVWGVELSPFVLKLQACLDFHKTPYRRLPAHGSYLENLQTLTRLEYQKQHKQITRFPSMDKHLDEYPAVPFYSENGKDFQYDSSSIAAYLDEQAYKSSLSTQLKPSRLFPESQELKFIASLIDEAFDEFGLYMVHHMRWVGSARSNKMGKLLAKEFRRALPPGGGMYLSKSFPKRQVRRCPYLFSVAPKAYKSGVSKALSPPSRKGFPETHTLLFESWRQYIKCMETLLSEQAYLLGDDFTIADASAYGQLAMNLVDPEASALLEKTAPRTFQWLHAIYQRKHLTTPKTGKLYISKHLNPLLNTIMSTFTSLMVQNQKAYALAKQQGVSEFNELAFDQGKALYTGKLRGYPFKSVVKTFQVRVWQELCEQWQDLSSEQQQTIKSHMELCELFETNSNE
jgi:Glutathione S-transferase, C-terminal domain